MPLKAGQSEIIQASQKDDEYKSFFKNFLGEIVKYLTETQVWIRWQEEVQLCGDVIYYGITTLSGYQTLGEEYCSLVQVDQTAENIPTKWQRYLMVVIQVIVPYITKRLLCQLENRLQYSATESKMEKVLVLLTPLLKQLICVMQRCHLTTFYFWSVYYEIGKRLSGIQYILARGVVQNNDYQRTYIILGCVTLLHFLVSLAHFFHRSIQILPDVKDVIQGGKQRIKANPVKRLNSYSSGEVKCILCLDKLHDITATPCGHMFCWYCINQWCRNKSQCPLCREDLETQQLVYLHHFQP